MAASQKTVRGNSQLVIIGTDHRLQNSVVRDETKAWVPRTGGHRYRRLIVYCIQKFGVKVILEEAHEKQESWAPTIASSVAKGHHLIWQPISLGEPGPSDGLFDPPLFQAMSRKVKPELLAGVYDLNTQGVREAFMRDVIENFLQEYDCVLAIVGFTHLGVLARMFENEVLVKALLFTDALVVDETKS